MDPRFLPYIPRDDIYLFNTGNAQKAWLAFGCRFIPELQMHRFLVWAPNARSVYLVGDFNSWHWDDTPMEQLEGGVWCVFMENVWEGQKYKYCIESWDGRRTLKADPFAAMSQTRNESASIVWCREQFDWHDADYLAARAGRNFMSSPMSIYEVHPGSWQDLEGGVNYRNLADALAGYCADMGYTHVELMPITEYPFDGSWGYQVTGYYAPTSRYGNPDDFKYFVDRLHQAGLGVIMDWVPAHFPKDEHGLANFDGTPLYECKERRMAEHPEWGTLIFDYASTQVQSFLISSACKFFEVFHIDGIRVDAVSSMLYLNYARRDGEFTPNEEGGSTNLQALRFLRKLNSAVLSTYAGAVTIAEESTAFPLITAPPDVGGVGFCLKWDMGFMHDTIEYMQMDPLFRSFHHNKLTFSMMYAFSENFVLAYSHDEVVHGKYSMINKMSGDYEQKFASLRTLYGYQFGHPGKKLTFMGSEFGQFIEWNWQQGLDWLLLGFRKHEQLRQYMRALNRLYTATPALYAVDKSWDGFKWLNVDDAGRSSVAFLRSSTEDNSYIVCVSNFTPIRYDNFLIGLPFNGSLHEVLNSDDEQFGGSGVKNVPLIHAHKQAFLDMQYSASITLPPLSTVFFRYKPRK
ncbi:MAG: 1,4-alpha-glucan branching protein GlgB [Oscillospiraceae bacterium]|nr:1,4-alpha-glucan branching protein GlgB [Oscillospiraceae bacterium]